MKPSMTPSTSENEAVRHVQVLHLLPWYLQHSLSPEERQLVDAHLPSCAICRSALKNESVMAAAIEPRIAELDMERAWTKMMARLDAPLPVAEETKHVFTPKIRTRLLKVLRGFGRHIGRPISISFAWLWAPQLAMALVLAVVLNQPKTEAVYQVLGNGAAIEGIESNVVVVFKPEAKQASIVRLLQKYEARIVDGPTVTNAYLLRVPEAQLQQAIDDFRGNDVVELAQTLSSGERQ